MQSQPGISPLKKADAHCFFRIVKEQNSLASNLEARRERRTRRSRLGSSGVTGGGERDRTDDLLLAKQALSQLSYTPGRSDGGSGWIRTNDPRLIKTVL